MKKIYANAIIRGKYTYGMENWGGSGKTEINQIQIQQNKAAKIATYSKDNLNKSTEKSLKELNWLPIEKEIEYVTHIKTYNTINSTIDDEMTHLIPKNTNKGRLQHNNKLGNKPKKLVQNKQSRSTYRNRSYKYNTLPNYITNSKTLTIFKDELRKFMLK